MSFTSPLHFRLVMNLRIVYDSDMPPIMAITSSLRHPLARHIYHSACITLPPPPIYPTINQDETPFMITKYIYGETSHSMVLTR